MPHIHTQPNQHDMTISAYIVRHFDNEWQCMVHFHKKIDVYMQIGGHIELDETPWQAVAHELEEESGYTLAELDVLQYTAERSGDVGNIVHPTPFTMNTHNVGEEHYHSDLCYGFVANDVPKTSVGNDESDDIIWASLDELSVRAEQGEVLKDVVEIYSFLLRNIDNLVKVPATSFSAQKPKSFGVTYKRGAVSEQRN